MDIKYQEQDRFYSDFLPLIAELECGNHYDPNNSQHVDWLKKRVAALYASGGKAVCLYSDECEPMGFVLIVHDPGLQDVHCFGKKATIVMLGLFPQHRHEGNGGLLLREVEEHVMEAGGECIYVDTYARNADAIRYYVREGFTPVAYHPGENGLGDRGQVYLFKELRPRQQ